MKVDLHCHTLKTKSGDPQTRNVTPEIFSEKIKNADVKIVGITNHNLFDINQYRSLQAAVSGECLVWPGVELDVMSDFTGKQWHLIVVSDPNTVNNFDRQLNSLVSGFTPETCMLKIEDIVNAFSSIDCFYIPHYHKTPEISEEDSKKLLELVKDDYKILNETSDVRSMGVFANHNHRVIVGSDVRDWSNYESSTFSELRLPVESFHQLYMLAKRDRVMVQTLLNKNISRKLKVSVGGNDPIEIELYNEVNVIFGSKGTGKTEILQDLKTKLESLGYTCSYYFAGEKEDEFKKLQATDSMRRYVATVGSIACDDEIREVKAWSDENPTPIDDYLQWCSIKDAGANKKRMRITLASTPFVPDSKFYLEAETDLVNIKKSAKVLNRVDITKYLTEAKVKQLNSLLSDLDVSATKEFKEKLIDYYATDLSKKSIESIKGLADNKTGSKSKPGTTGFNTFSLNRLKLHRNTQKILDNIIGKERKARDLVGSLDGKGNVYIQSIYRMCCKESGTKEFNGKKKTDLLDLIRKLNTIKDNYTSANIYGEVTQFKNAAESVGVNSTEFFLGLSKEVVLANGQIYKPSGGEKAILVMQKALSADEAVYIFDEPELGMGNSYIDEHIRPKLTQLGKSKKMVIVATHNANIAVRTLPYTTIFRDHDNGVYKTYAGNAFVNLLENIADATDVKNWKDTSMKVLEGGQEAFYERKNIYESRKS